MITGEMKLTKNCWIYAAMFGVDVPMTQNEEKVKEHLMAKEIEKLVEGMENIRNDAVDNSISNCQNDPDTRLELMSNKESPEVKKTADVSQPVNVIEKEDESAKNNYELRRREGGLIMESQQSQADVAKMIAEAIQQERENLQAEISLQINNAITNHIPSQTSNTPCRTSAIHPRDQDDPYDDAHPKGENNAKRQKTSVYGTYVFRDSSSSQDNERESGPSTSVSQEFVEEMSQTIDDAKLHKVVDEMLRQRCTSRDEHQYNIDQMQNFLKNDIMWESRKHILSLPSLQKQTLVVQSCQRDPKAPTLSLINQDLLYLKKGNSDYKNLNKNDIEDMYLLCINDKNNKKEKRVMRHQEVHKFCGVTLKRVLEGLKSYNNDVKHGYETPSLSKKDVEYLQLFEEEIKEWLKHRDQMIH
nr:hypothetical protein [Tanacetum cinerariifolium]